MAKKALLAMFIPGDNPPALGFDIEWSDDYLTALNSVAPFSGYFKPASAGGLANTIVLGTPGTLPVEEFDISNYSAFSSVWASGTTVVKLTDNTAINNVQTDTPLTVFHATGTGITVLPPLADGAEVRVDGVGIPEPEIEQFYSPLVDSDTGVAIPNLVIENNGNAPVPTAIKSAVETAGGVVWQDNVGIMSFYTTASVATNFNIFINSGAAIDWYQDNVLVASSTNNHTFFFTDSSVKFIQVRGADVNQGQWLSMTSKSLTGTVDLSSMVSAAARIDFSNNPNLTEVLLPQSSGVMDQCMGYNTGISTLRLDKLPGLVNSSNIQIRLGDCPNLDVDSVAQNILRIDTATATGRQFWINGTTPDISTPEYDALIANGWTVVL